MIHNLKFCASWWRKLKQLGYDVIPLYAKDAPCKGWPKMANDEAAIEGWSGAGAAVRMRGSELLVIDLDIHAAAVRDKMLAWLTEHHPAFMRACLRRHSERVTLALIGRCITAKATQKTARYLGEGADPKGDFVEVFTGNSKKYVGVLGRHSEGRSYDFTGRSIIEMPADVLPWFPDSAIAPMIAAFEQIMVAHGWEKKVPTIGKDAIGTKVYDLEPGMIFILSDGEKVTLKELEANYKGYVHASPNGKVTGYATLWDPTTGGSEHSKSRVIVTLSRREGLCLFDTKYEVRHRWKNCDPSKKQAEMAAMLREIMETMRRKPEERP